MFSQVYLKIISIFGNSRSPHAAVDPLLTKERSGLQVCWKRQEFGLIDLGPYLRVICRAGDSWLTCTSLKAAWPPPTDLETCLNLMPEIPCTTSVGFQRLLVFTLSPSAQPLLLTHNIWVCSISHFFHPGPQPSLLFTPHCFYTVTETGQALWPKQRFSQPGGTVIIYLTWCLLFFNSPQVRHYSAAALCEFQWLVHSFPSPSLPLFLLFLGYHENSF